MPTGERAETSAIIGQIMVRDAVVSEPVCRHFSLLAGNFTFSSQATCGECMFLGSIRLKTISSPWEPGTEITRRRQAISRAMAGHFNTHIRIKRIQLFCRYLTFVKQEQHLKRLTSPPAATFKSKEDVGRVNNGPVFNARPKGGLACPSSNLITCIRTRRRSNHDVKRSSSWR